MYSLNNQIVTIQVASKGAELQSIFHQQNQLEYMWSGDPAYWGKKSPVLFPIVGELKNKRYVYQDKEYSLSRHGFAREMDFDLLEQTPNFLTFTLRQNDKTLENYPFNFSFSVRYTLTENIVSITYIVKNTDSKQLLFSVGGHPAFKVPLMTATSFEDYYLLFDTVESAGISPLKADGLVHDSATPFLTNTNKLPLTRELFAKDALVFKNLQSKSISIVSDKTLHGLKVSFEGFPYLGIWSTKAADFVCIEPWCGIADSVNASGLLEVKEGINRLGAGETFERTFSIEVF
jgi:galactose mutarotase-like enzyme